FSSRRRHTRCDRDWSSDVCSSDLILVCGVSFAVPQFLISNFVNPWIVDIGASLICMACLIGFFRFWQPAELWTSPALRSHDASAATMPPPRSAGPEPTLQQLWWSLVPWISVCVVCLISVSANLASRTLTRLPGNRCTPGLALPRPRLL